MVILATLTEGMLGVALGVCVVLTCIGGILFVAEWLKTRTTRKDKT